MNPEPIRLGIAGTGIIASFLAPEFAALPGVTVAACMNPDRQLGGAFAAKHGIGRSVERLDDLLPLVDAVYVASPDRFHHAQTLAALAAGKHVLCEKPVASSLAEAREMATSAAVAAVHGIVTAVDFAHHRKPALERAAALVAEGAIGAVRHISCHYLQTWQTSPIWGNWWDPAWVWRLDPVATSGTLTDLGSHAIDTVFTTAGAIRRVQCATGTWPKRRDGVDLMQLDGRRLDANDSAVITLEMASGALGSVQLSRRATGRADSLGIELFGTDGAISLDLERSPHRLSICTGDGAASTAWYERDCPAVLSIAARFIAAVRARKAIQPDLIRGAEVQAVLETCLRATTSGRWEDVAGVGVESA